MRRLLVLSVMAGLLGGLPGLTDLARADCGPGPIVTQKNKKSVWQSFGASTNATFLPTQTFSITSGTSGCSNSGIIHREVEQRFFVAVQQHNIHQEMAQGGGSYLRALASLMGCGGQSYGRFAAMTRQKLGLLYPAADSKPSELLARLKEEIRGDPLLARGCGRIS